ncbi:MAG: hypothetical protein A4S09_14665 [Proteobacteria bacterium SG_bin7]|nr:MAG: hypothetical protein A4S09_14665 [Proteobacteria bacterium SG_bin7]
MRALDNISEEKISILKWMTKDLENYLANFDDLFEAKLKRISEHQQQRLRDMENALAPLRKALAADPNSESLKAEISRLTNELKPHGFVQEFTDTEDFIYKFVGEKGKVLKNVPTRHESQKMDRPGLKKLYVDTWGVPFFNTATQSKDEAKTGVMAALKIFSDLDFNKPITFKKFTDLLALFARPEFDDVRRFKIQIFPSKENQNRFLGERSDALVAGKEIPDELFIFVNRKIDLDSFSYSFGLRKHIVEIVSHADRSTGDGRIFTGPADAIEHELSHAFFNLSKSFPGTPEDWKKIHEEFFFRKQGEADPGKRKMMSLVYFHLTHESGYRALMQIKPGVSEYKNLINEIREKIKILYYYDWVPGLPEFNGNYESYLEPVFAEVSSFFKQKFLELQRSYSTCPVLF